MKEELQVIMDLMKDLQDKMEFGKEDFSERLGRKEPGVEVLKVEGKLPTMEMAEGSPEEESSESPMEESMEDDMGGVEESPEEKLKSRLLKLRG